MKSRIFFFVVFLFSSYFSPAQQREGKVIYAISYPSADLPKSQQALLPTESTIWFRNEQVRMEMSTGAAMNAITITGKEGVTTLMDLMGKKIAITLTNNEIEKQEKEAGSTKTSYPAETKKIAGYACHKAIMDRADGTSMTVWYTDALALNPHWNAGFSQVKGFPMEYTLETNGLTMHMTARSVSEEKISSDLFNIPGGYEKMTAAQLKQLFEGLR